MGYHENVCQICAVSFNLARCRTKYEPPEAAWGYSTGLYYAGEAETCLDLSEETGCEEISINGRINAHIAGPNCVFDGGYSGYRISVAQMKDMRLSRYIIKKPEDLSEEEDAPDYEKCSDYFITDQSISTQDDWEPGALPRYRYAVNSFMAMNYEVIEEDGFSRGVPVHDSCWKIFERVSKIRLEGLTSKDLWPFGMSACSNCGFQNIKQESILRECKQQWWSHIPGSEYLAANPHEIPGFSLILSEAYGHQSHCDKNKGSVWRKKQFNGNLSQLYVNSTDHFNKLPIELRHIILYQLGSKDIANLRLVSRAFRQLPQRLFRHLLVKELPWFWEIDQIQQRKMEQYRKMLLDLYGEDLAGLEGRDDFEYVQFVKDCVAMKPPSFVWKRVYDRVKLLQKGNLGVRNRVRVWGLAERIAERIGHLRGMESTGKRYDLRYDEDNLQVKPTKEEVDSGAVNHGHECSECN
ncbi:hypothetical protein BCON_0153g00100 [Botryotinia convoluta]|uniref:F-box domain-containing protein n=1 Tax=Botryotinia convoluta TaxID=54673 RepID=A0A4Z1HSW7_9HELO|nr:hypothetical protein BCON_0153g00100 [Botryotinia convoluta]